MNVYEALKSIQSRLSPLIGEYAIPQSEEIMEYLLHSSRSSVYLRGKELLKQSTVDTLEAIIKRRLSGEPLQYILGKTFFYSREFNVTTDVLIPRPDTEILIEQVLRFQKNSNSLFADIGIGSGIISSILTEENRGWKALGIDISFKSLLVAKSNRKSSVYYVCGDLLKSIVKKPVFDFIVSNPPYISKNELNVLDHEVLDFEPYRALYGGVDGLNFYRYFAENAFIFIKNGGAIYCEIGYNQEKDVTDLFSTKNWCNIQIFKDLNQHPRVIRAVKSEC